MKITYMHQYFSLPGQPGGSRPYEFAKRLARDGYDVTVIAGGPTRSKEFVEGFTLVRVPARYKNAMSFSARVRAFLSYVAGATATSLATPCDVVFASSTPLTVAIPALVTKYLRRKPMVFEVRDLWPELPIRLGVVKNPALIWVARKIERLTYAASEYVVALSPWMEDGVKKAAPSARTVLIPNASDFERYEFGDRYRDGDRRELGWEGKTVLVYAGSFGISYDLEWLVRLAAALDDNFEVVMYGEGASSDSLKALALSLGLDAARMFPGRVPRETVARRFKSADVVVSCLSDNPVLEHNSLNKVFDGLAAGRPVLTNHGGWLTELIEEYNAGMRLPRDIGKAKTLLESEFARLDLREMGANASRLGADYFDRDVLYEKLSATLIAAAR